jgi:hypothetical protein
MSRARRGPMPTLRPFVMRNSRIWPSELVPPSIGGALRCADAAATQTHRPVRVLLAVPLRATSSNHSHEDRRPTWGVRWPLTARKGG